MKAKKLIISILLFYAGWLNAATNNIQWVPTKTAAINYQKMLQPLPKKTLITIRIPSQLPLQSNQKIFLNFAQDDAKQYSISFDTSPTCHAAKYCALGYISGKLSAKPELYQDSKGKTLTQPVELLHHVPGYFTPGHAMADYWPPMLSWREGNVLYTLTWQFSKLNDEETKSTLIDFANAFIGDMSS